MMFNACRKHTDTATKIFKNSAIRKESKQKHS